MALSLITSIPATCYTSQLQKIELASTTGTSVTLTINTQVPITGLHTHTLSAQFGFVATNWRVYGTAALEHKRGDLLFVGRVDYGMFMQHVQECVRLQYTFPLKGKYSWLVGAQTRLHQYENAHAWQVGIETGLTF